MATRSGGATVAQVGRLQEARDALERHLGFPVACSIGRDLRLLAFPKTPEERALVEALGGPYRGFHVEVRETPKTL